MDDPEEWARPPSMGFWCTEHDVGFRSGYTIGAQRQDDRISHPGHSYRWRFVALEKCPVGRETVEHTSCAGELSVLPTDVVVRLETMTSAREQELLNSREFTENH